MKWDKVAEVALGVFTFWRKSKRNKLNDLIGKCYAVMSSNDIASIVVESVALGLTNEQETIDLRQRLEVIDTQMKKASTIEWDNPNYQDCLGIAAFHKARIATICARLAMLKRDGN